MRNYLTYAFGEVLLIMVGILLALQVNTWNQGRLNAQEEKQLLVALSKEMELNRFRYEHGKKYQDGVLEAAEQILVTIQDPEEQPSLEPFNQTILKITERWFLTTSTSTYDVLLSSGQLGLLSSVELRNRLAFLKLQMELLSTYERIQANFIDEQLRPFLNGYIDRLSGIESALGLSDSIHRRSVGNSFDQLISNTELSNLLVDLIQYTQDVQGVYSNIENVMNRIDSLVAGVPIY